MAKTIKVAKGKEFAFKAAPKGGGGESKYPWDAWFAPTRGKDGTPLHTDGQGELLLLEQSLGTKDDKGTVTEVTEKRDFEVDTNTMPAKLKTAARKRHKVCQISRIDADGKKLKDSIIIRARDMDAEERLAEDVLREEERAETFIRRKAAKEKAAAEANGAETVNLHTPPAQAV